MTDHVVRVTVNGVPYNRMVPARMLLSDFLRHELRLVGTHVGCEHGVCGACTVLVDDRATRACLVFAVMVDGATVETVEGLTPESGKLHPVQQAFTDCHALQCGFCTPGFVMSLVGLSREVPAPSDEDIDEAIGGNLCRCTGYRNIKAAAVQALAVTHESDRSRPV